MKITVDYNENESKELKIISASYLGDYSVEVNFDDGQSKIIDFKEFLKSSLNPKIRVYLDKSKFTEFKIQDFNLNWNDYDMIFPVWDLYRGQIK
ncbi:DUF2442 domain-containing protein [Marivirga sp.]|uniref:DUF2442 domain-containing protein n=1 Tax=Marivirga sp. TaxID=2018662 RepID=UPI00260009C7|nr:DUF2442 domain-containing protein [Marivirga sp.]